jgi:hypothetical protein
MAPERWQSDATQATVPAMHAWATGQVYTGAELAEAIARANEEGFEEAMKKLEMENHFDKEEGMGRERERQREEEQTTAKTASTGATSDEEQPLEALDYQANQPFGDDLDPNESTLDAEMKTKNPHLFGRLQKYRKAKALTARAFYTEGLSEEE